MSLLPVSDVLSGWRLAPEPPPPLALRPQPVLQVLLHDEITGQPPAVLPAASTTTIGMRARISGNGFAGLVAQPLRQFLPGYVTGVPLQLSLSGSGYLPITFNTAIGGEPGYPAAYTPVDLGLVALHRAPVVIGGRTVSHGHTVRAGAEVSLDHMWLTLADLANPPVAPNLVTLASPMYADRDTMATVAQQNLATAPLTEAKTLLLAGNVGDTTVRLSDQVGLVVGSIIAIDHQDLGRAEYLAVTAISQLGGGPSFPAAVTLAFPLARPHVLGATAIRMVPAAAGASNALSLAARAGDVTLLPSAMAGLNTGMSAVVVSGGGTAAAEYHAAKLLGGISDTNGYVVLPPVHRVAQLRLRVQHTSEPTDLICDVMLPGGTGALSIDFVFPP